MNESVSIEEPDVARALAGDAGAFERIYRRHVDVVYRLAHRMHGAAEADALTQDVFVRAWQKLATFRGDSRFSTWLHRIAVNLFISHRRDGRGATDARVDLEQLPAAAEPTGLRLDLERAVGRLPARARAVFVLCALERMSHGECADLLGVSVGTSKSQLHRARNLLCEMLEEEDG